MNAELSNADRGILLLMTALIGAWGVSGALDVYERTEAGLRMGANHGITHLEPGGPAEQVHMQVGDRIIRIDGKDVEDTANLVRLPRVEVGERRSYTVVRGEDTIRYRPEFRPLDTQTMWLEHLATIVGFSFLLIPLAACLTRPSAATRVLALMGFGLSLAFFDGLYIISYEIRAVAAAVAQLFMLLGLAAMVHFLLLFPHRRPLLHKPWGKKLVYVPMVIIWLLIAWRILWTPPADSIAAFTSQFLSGLGITLYLLIGLFLLLRNYSRTDRAERKRLAFNRMLWGTVAAIIPTAVAQLVRVASPDTPLPGQDYYFVALALVPITWSLSAARAHLRCRDQKGF
jgi:hypothetical protein